MRPILEQDNPPDLLSLNNHLLPIDSNLNNFHSDTKEKLWTEYLYSDQERTRFSPFTVKCGGKS